MATVEIIGNGRAFDFEQTNTSFLMRRGAECWLSYCGVSVPRTLYQLKLLDQITHVVITHAHADHSGGLELSAYYWELEAKRNVAVADVPIFSNGHVHPYLLHALPWKHVLFFNPVVIPSPRDLPDAEQLDDGAVYAIKHLFHLVCDSFMYIFVEGDDAWVFTGDATVHDGTVRLVERLLAKFNVIIFHDYDPRGVPVHAGPELWDLFEPLKDRENFALIPVHWGGAELVGTKVNGIKDARALMRSLWRLGIK